MSGGVATSSDYHSSSSSVERLSKAAGPSIRQIRESMSRTNPAMQPPSMFSQSLMQQKKKSSIFGGFFATKEPTQLALNQVAAQLTAQHGSTMPGKVPHVSSERMPDYVPKVNSKWDGVPDAVKQRDKKEKDRQKALTRQSTASNISRARSVESSERKGRHLRSARSSSRERSRSSRGRSMISHHSDPRSPNPHKFYAQSVNSSGDLAAQHRADDNQDSSTSYSQSLKSPSTTSLPNITTSLHEDIPPPPAVPAAYRSTTSTRTRHSMFSGSSRASKTSQPSLDTAPPPEAIPEHTSSPVATPRTGSPVTPLTQQAHEHFSNVRSSFVSSQDRVSLDSSGPNVLPLPVNTKNKVMKRQAETFLAGEARPFELPDEDDDSPPASRDLPLRQWGGLRGSLLGQKAPELPPRSIDRLAQDLSKRPDSSRSRLGLKASMLVRTEATPWEGQANASALSPTSANARSRVEPDNPKRLIPSFGAFRKKES